MDSGQTWGSGLASGRYYVTSPFFSTPAKTPWASGSAPISRYSGGFPRIPAEGVVTDVTDVVFHIFCPCGAGKKHDPSRPEPGQDTGLPCEFWAHNVRNLIHAQPHTHSVGNCLSSERDGRGCTRDERTGPPVARWAVAATAMTTRTK